MTTSGRDPTLIGRVRHVLGATLTVELNDDVAGSAALYRGRVYHVGQIGSLVICDQGPIRLIGAVTLLGISELITPTAPAHVPQQGERWLMVQLLGELDALGNFHRGISTFPALDDEVRFATSQELSSIYPGAGAGFVPVGHLSTSRSDVVRVDLGRLVSRHSAVVGSTGSGKSTTVARILQSVVEHDYLAANIIVIDPHGEYKSAFERMASIMSIRGSGDGALSIPYWALGLDDLLRAYAGAGVNITPVVRNKVQELVLSERRRFLEASKWPVPPVDDINVDTPIPFDLRSVWYNLDFHNRGTVRGAKSSSDFAVVDKGDPATLRGAKFEPYGPGGQPPNQCTTYGQYSPLPDRMATRLKDPRFGFLERERCDPRAPDPLASCLEGWLGRKKPISILDFSGVPSEAADVAIGAVLTLLFEVAVACPTDAGIGRASPIWIILEEAHRFIGQNSSGSVGSARSATERIAREGRKYGLGLMLVSQRPAELSDTALSQCGTIVALRLSNPGDQSKVKSSLPDTVANLADALPALRTGECLISGEAIALPSRVLVDRASPEPSAADANCDAWLRPVKSNDADRAVKCWRGVKT